MNNDIMIFYYDGDNISRLEEFTGEIKTEKIKMLPEVFFIEEAGFYKIGEKIYELNKEGLYRFINEKGNKQQYCYHKENAILLIKVLILCFDFLQFTNKKGFITYYPMINSALRNNLMKEFSLVEFIKIVLTSRKVPWRQGYFVSKESEESLGTCIELWDELLQSWNLYWLDANINLGKTDINKTYIDTMEDFFQKKIEVEPLVKIDDVEDMVFDEKQILKEFENLSKQKVSQVDEFVLKQAFPVMKKNFASTKAFTECKYFDKDIEKIYLDSKTDVEYQIYFEEYDYIKEFFYGFQYHVFAGKVVQTNKNLK